MSSPLSYPHSELTACVDKPTPEGIRITVAELCANANSISSTLGGGGHGHQGAVLSDTAYAALAGATNAYVLPNPPVPPTPATMAAAMAANAHMTPSVQLALYDMDRATYETAVRVETGMRRQFASGLLHIRQSSLPYSRPQKTAPSAVVRSKRSSHISKTRTPKCASLTSTANLTN
jgi:hypothetical protein